MRTKITHNKEKSEDSESGSGSRSRRGKMTHKNRKILEISCLNCWMFFLKAGGFSCSLNALYEGQGINILQFLIKKINFYFNCKISQLLVIKSLDPDRDPH
jgi:hypothetical protein